MSKQIWAKNDVFITLSPNSKLCDCCVATLSFCIPIRK